MNNKLTKLVTQVRNIALNISSSFSFNNKQKNQQNSQKKSKNPENITKTDSYINKDDIHLNQNLDNIDNLQEKHLQQIDFLHICETNNERDNNFSLAQSKAHIRYEAPSNSNNSPFKIFYIINNPNENKTGGGSTLIMTQQLHNHLESTTLLIKGRYIYTTFNFKNKTKIFIHSIYLPNLELKHKELYKNIIIELFTTTTNKTKSRDFIIRRS
ncbi:hypothetical protein RhiirC2_787683 [Rhizophagus irregularis]|uniref:Uncharacterized protein n=1 Tax=Rhizophagus irregularis TaxID=588596 RepID=A0A2N1MRP8_9GLOM|nr:hypothetical protein RhiirC2_787683 [Rhizophagus irregularis]